MTLLGGFLIAYLVTGQCVWELTHWRNPRGWYNRRHSPIAVSWGVVLLWPMIVAALVDDA